jgi:hypothetical protein
MAEPTLELIMKILLQVQSEARETNGNVRELVRRVSAVEQQIAFFHVSLANQEATFRSSAGAR